uniref:Transmembrane protein 120B-A n=1 Tax=Phallusia mammillata TaxID=59560 RepID=A0A6F9DUC9_9ASCI|nr:transmembrane protein 120B-A [Phallusia mammillata]
MEVAQRVGAQVSFTTCKEEWADLGTDYDKCMEKYKEYKKAAESYHTLRNTCKSQTQRQLKKISMIKSALKKIPNNPEKEELLKQIDEKKRSIQDIEKFLPRKNGFYLGLIVGQVNMILDSTAEKFRYKDEYERFKFYCSVTMMIFAIFLNTFVFHRVFDAMFSFLLLWYYCTLTVRESILIVNGSRIKGWWVMHHYVSVVLSGINVLWPDDDAYREFRPVFMAFSIYQSLVQLMQYYYQSGCLYRLRALGERDDMDITVEGFQSWMWRGLTFLLPFLFFGHFWQLYNAFTLMNIGMSHNFQEWQVPCLAFLFCVLFCGNFFTTIIVVWQKRGGKKGKRD